MSNNYDETALLTRITDLEQQLVKKPEKRGFLKPLASVFFVASGLPLMPTGALYVISKAVDYPMQLGIIWTFVGAALMACVGAFILSSENR